MAGLRIGSLCSGYRGLDMAVEEVFGASTAWVSDIDPGANKILAHRWPSTPNIGDLTTTHWEDVEPVDILCGGYPCQPFSTAGLRKGTEDERHIWPYITDALRVLRPRVAIFENVAGHLRLGFDTVLADLARLGFDAEWCLVRAAEVGAPHPRQRLFIYATAQDTDREPRDKRRLAAPEQAESRRTRADLGGRGGASAAHACGIEPERRGVAGVLGSQAAAEPGEGDQRQWAGDTVGDRCAAAADADSGRGAGEHLLWQGQPDATGSSLADAGSWGRDRVHERVEPGYLATGAGEGRAGIRTSAAPGPSNWGRYADAVHRWESVLGRSAPRATDDRNRLSPSFVEWMMGVPAGHVTEVPGLSRAQQLKALGNGVVPQQAAAAIRLLHHRAIRDRQQIVAA